MILARNLNFPASGVGSQSLHEGKLFLFFVFFFCLLVAEWDCYSSGIMVKSHIFPSTEFSPKICRDRP